jgi:molybdopterin converting factor small subunit
MATIKIPSIWRAACQGEPVVQVPPGNLLQVLKAAVEQWPLLRTCFFIPTGEVNPALNFFINQEHVRYRGGLQAPVDEGDEIYVIPMITGGCGLEMA